MKTLGETKKGLGICKQGGNWHDTCGKGCPYAGNDECAKALPADALAHIQYLEKEVEIREIQKNAMFAKAEKLQCERDFLLKYLTDSRCVPCDICKHEPENGGITACDRVRKVKGPCFEWRGLPEGGSENDNLP